MARTGRLSLLRRTTQLIEPFYRVCFLATAGSSGLLAALKDGPVPFEQLAERFAPDPETRDALEGWLMMGVKLKEVKYREGSYSLSGSLAKSLSDPNNDDVLALIEEMSQLHHTLITQLPARLREKRLFTLDDGDGTLIARSSRFLEPLVHEAIEAAVPRKGPIRLLEIGCGSGTYVRYSASLNPELTALGLELQPDVAEVARKNLFQWGVSDRTNVEAGDVRKRTPQGDFDLVTLHNNIYYFPVAQRIEVLAHVARFLKPGGQLLMTTGCQGGSVGMDILSLWGAATEGCGRLPTPDELVDHLEKAGFMRIRCHNLLPGDSYYYFLAFTRS